jgi:hypothetical protein
VGLADRDYMKRDDRGDTFHDRLFEPVGRAGPRRSTRSVLIVLAITLFGLFVLPHLAIGGRHYRFWVF